MSKRTKTIEHVVELPASPDAVYTGFVDPKIHTKMTGGKATGKAEVNGEFTAWDGYIFGRYLELEPGKRILVEWQTTAWPEAAKPSRLELTFAPVKHGTKLTMVHSDVPAEQVQDYDDGWRDYYWEPMAKYFSKQTKKEG